METIEKCTYATNSLLLGNQDRVLSVLTASQYRRTTPFIPIPLTTLEVASLAGLGYLETLHHLKHLELDGSIRKVDYYPNPYILIPIEPIKLRLQWWVRQCGKVFDPSTGEIRFRTPNDFALWVIS